MIITRANGANRKSRGLLLAITAALVAPGLPVSAQTTLEAPEERIIGYDSSENRSDPIVALEKRLAAGQSKLEFRGGSGYLPALLRELRIPISSQGLVFSKTSSQRDKINPRNPRAVYFSECAAVGFVPTGQVIEIAAIDPQRGPVFYTLDQTEAGAPRFTRATDCMQCHLSSKTLNVPGLLVRSVCADSNGVPISQVMDFVNGHNSPLQERWGGWYVTGKHSQDRHLGNIFADSIDQAEKESQVAPSSLLDLRRRFDVARYPSPHSDIVALMVLEHQLRMQNLMTHANYETRYALDELAKQDSAVAASAAAWPRSRIAAAGEMLLEYMLFRNEAPLKGQIQGTSTFTTDFAAAGPRGSRGRSLREFDLRTRLFRYPCSYMIYSQAFDALPADMKNYLWDRLSAILSGRDTSGVYALLTAGEQKDLLEILRETKPEFSRWLQQHDFQLGMK